MQAFRCTRSLHGIVWNSGRLDYREHPNILPRIVKSENFAKGTEKCNLLAGLMDIEVEDFVIMVVVQFKIRLMKNCGFARVSHSDTRPYFTVQRARQRCLVT